MGGITERLGGRALARAGAPAGQELEAIAQRAATFLNGVIRLLAIPAGVGLMLSSGADPWTILPVAALALVWVAASTSRELRTPALLVRNQGWTTVGDVVTLTLAMALSGGVDSPVRLLLVPVPIAAGLVLTPRGVLLCALGNGAGFAALGAPGVPLAAVALALAWATSIGAVAAWQRERSLRGLAAVDEARRAVLGGARGAEGAALGVELRDAALDPLLLVARALPAAGPADLRRLTQQVALAAQRLRSIVVELHVLTAGQGGLRGSLEALAHRRSPSAAIAVDSPSALPAAQLVLVTGLAREALRAVADATTRHVAIDVFAGVGSAIVLEVRGTPPLPLDATQAAHARAFQQRATLAGGVSPTAADGIARVLLQEHVTPERPPTWSPGRSLHLARQGLLLTHGGGIATALLIALVAGGAELPFFLAGAFLVLWTPVIVDATTQREDFRRWALVTAPLVIGMAVMVGNLGTATAAELPLLVAVPPCFGLQLSPLLTGTMNALVALALALAGLSSTVFLLAFAWSTAAALLLAVAIATLEGGVGRVAQIRRELVDQLAERQERERRALAEEMHDETLQVLLATRQDLEEAADGEEEARERAADGLRRAIVSLRAVAGDLDLQDGTLTLPDGAHEALQEIAGAVMARGGPRVEVDCHADAVGHHDGLVVRLARELVANAVTHANAERVQLHLVRADGHVVLEVTDDGRGVDAARMASAVSRGHIGLASCRERVAISGGTLALDGADGGGTRVRVELPLRSA